MATTVGTAPGAPAYGGGTIAPLKAGNVTVNYAPVTHQPGSGASTSVGDAQGTPNKGVGSGANNGVGGAPVAAPPAPLGADPAYNAFLAKLGLTDANLRDAATLRMGNIDANVNKQMPGIQQAEGDAVNHTMNVMNGRGILNSSDAFGAHGAVPMVQAQYAARMAALQSGAQSQKDAIIQNIAQQLANGQAAAIVQGQTAAGNVATNAALAGPNPYYTPVAAAAPTGP